MFNVAYKTTGTHVSKSAQAKEYPTNEAGPVYVTYNKHADMNRRKEAPFTDGKPGLTLLKGIRFSQLSFLYSISQ